MVEKLPNAVVDGLTVISSGFFIAMLIGTGIRGPGAVNAGVFVGEVAKVNTEVVIKEIFLGRVEAHPPPQGPLQLARVTSLLYTPFAPLSVLNVQAL